MPFVRWVDMMQMRKSIKYLLTLLLCVLTQTVLAQINGKVVDSVTGETIPFPSLLYKGHGVAVAGDVDGNFKIERHNGWYLTIKSVGYQDRRILINEKTSRNITVKLIPDTRALDEVVVKAKRRTRYTRKNNPAVELMQRVIAAKKKTDLENYPFYQFNKYQKITLAVNDIKPEDMEKGLFKNAPWLVNQVEQCEFTQKLILPLSVDETVTQHLYRKDPRTEKDVIMGQQSTGVNKVIQTGETVNTMLKEIFTDIDIYDDHVKLLQYHFPSPIGRTAISFYRYYIQDTVFVGNDKCYHLQFLPNNQQDFGFRGELYILCDSSLHVKRCDMTVPRRSGVNFVDNIRMQQEYTRLDNGEWVLTVDNMVAEMQIANIFTKAIVIRNTRLSDYDFSEISDKKFRGKAKKRTEADAQIRDQAFWDRYRTIGLTKSEENMGSFIKSMEQSKNFKWMLIAAKVLIENFVETHPDKDKSKFDIGPVNTFISYNFVDKWRFRLSGRTTARLNPHLFWDGYYAYGTKSRKHYYGTNFTYSFNKKKNQPFEYPQRTLSFESSFDVMSPSDKFIIHNKDNAFMAFKTQKVEQMYFYNRQKLDFVYETDWGFRLHSDIKLESNDATGDLEFRHMPGYKAADTSDPGYSADMPVGALAGKIRTSEITLGMKYSPGQTFINTKQQRIPTNYDSPEFSLSHTIGFDGLMGGQYKYNFTEAEIYKRFWLGSWGYINSRVKAGAQWNKVPFPLLIMPPVNLSYWEHEETFSLMNNMEFLNDRYVFWSAAWDMNGKLLNRIPLLKKLKWREYFAVKGMIGKLTDKNNPYLPENYNDPILFQFPDNVNIMDAGKPYWEIVVGVHNIFKLFEVDYVHRLSYNNLSTASRNGIRFGFKVSF